MIYLEFLEEWRVGVRGGRTNRIGKEFYSFEIPFETRKEMACLRNVTEKH